MLGKVRSGLSPYQQQIMLKNDCKALSLLEERFPSLAKALQADASFSDIVMGADKASAMNITDGAALTWARGHH